ncbi:uncharacterized protein LOC124593952 [Schistocerca americana]|uniref:uncharacterized protein LOC124593952 n=1 Tax=Schistocerca americana TaxID=7009 RepID=UPI001F4F55CA|nr:uncharacterized protein LOC124593952 [Schistocerca americana]
MSNDEKPKALHVQILDLKELSAKVSEFRSIGDEPKLKHLNTVAQQMKGIETYDVNYPISDSDNEIYKINPTTSLKFTAKHSESLVGHEFARNSAPVAVGDEPQRVHFNEVPLLMKELESNDRKFARPDSNEEGHKISEISSLHAIQKHSEEFDRNQKSVRHSALLAVGDVPPSMHLNDVPQLMKELESNNAAIASPDLNEEGYKISEISSLNAIQSYSEEFDRNQKSVRHSALLAVGGVPPSVHLNDVPQLMKELESNNATIASPDSNEEGYKISEISSLHAIQTYSEEFDRNQKSVRHSALLAVGDVPPSVHLNDVPQLMKELESNNATIASPDSNEEGYKISEISSPHAIQKHSEEFDRNQKSVRHSALLAVGDVPPSVHLNDVPQLMKELESNNATIASPDLNEEGYKISEISSLHAIQNYSEEFDRNQKSVRHSALLAVGDVPPSVHLNDVPQLMKELESNNATIASPDLNEEGYKISEISSLHAIQNYSEEFDRNQKSVRHSALLAVGDVPPSVHLNDVPQLMKELESNNATIASPDLNEEGYKISEISSLHAIQNYSEEFDRNQKSVRHSALLAVGDVPPSVHLNDVPQLMKELESNNATIASPDLNEEGYKISEISSPHAIQKHSEEFDRNQQSVRRSALIAVGDVPPSVYLNDVPQLMKELQSNNATIASPNLNEEGYKISEISSLNAIQSYSEEFDRNQKSVRHSALLAVGDVPPSVHLNDVPQLMKELESNNATIASPDSNEEGYKISEISSPHAIQKHSEEFDRNQKSVRHSALLAVGDVPPSVHLNDVPQLMKELESNNATIASPDLNEEGYKISEISSPYAIQKHSEEFDRNQKSVRHSALLAVGDVPPSVHLNDVQQLMKELESNNAAIASPDLNEEGYKISEISSPPAIQKHSEEFDRSQQSVRRSALEAVGDVPPSLHLNDVPQLMKELESNNATIASPDLNEEGYKISEISSLHAIQNYSEEFDRNQKSVRHSALLAVGDVPPSVHLNDVPQLMKELESNNATIASPDLNEEGYKISEISSLHAIQNYSEEFDRNQKSVLHSALLAVGDVPPSVHLNDVPQLMKELESNNATIASPDLNEEGYKISEISSLHAIQNYSEEFDRNQKSVRHSALLAVGDVPPSVHLNDVPQLMKERESNNATIASPGLNEEGYKISEISRLHAIQNYSEEFDRNQKSVLHSALVAVGDVPPSLHLNDVPQLMKELESNNATIASPDLNEEGYKISEISSLHAIQNYSEEFDRNQKSVRHSALLAVGDVPPSVHLNDVPQLMKELESNNATIANPDLNEEGYKISEISSPHAIQNYSEEFDRNQKSVRHSALLAVGDVPPSVHLNDVPQLMKELESNNATIASPDLNEEGYKISEISSPHAIQNHSEEFDRNQKSVRHRAIVAVGDVPPSVHLNDVPQLMKELESNNATIASPDLNEEGYKISEISSPHAIQNYSEEIDRNQKSVRHSALLAVGDVPPSVHLNDVPQLMKELESNNATIASPDLNEEGYKISEISSLHAIQNYSEEFDRNQKSVRHSALLAVGDVPPTVHLNDVPQLMNVLESNNASIASPDLNEEGYKISEISSPHAIQNYSEEFDRNQKSVRHSALLAVGDVPPSVHLNDVPQLMKELESNNATIASSDLNEEGYKISEVSSPHAIQNYSEEFDRNQKSVRRSALIAVGDVPPSVHLNDVPQLMKELESNNATIASPDLSEKGYKISEISSVHAIQSYSEEFDRNQKSVRHSARLAVGDVPPSVHLNDVPQLLKELESNIATIASADLNEEGYKISEISSPHAIQNYSEEFDRDQKSVRHSALLAVGDVPPSVHLNDVPQLMKELESNNATIASPDLNEEGYKISEISSLHAIQNYSEEFDRNQKSVRHSALLAVGDVPPSVHLNDVPQLMKELESNNATIASPDLNEEGYKISEISSLHAIQNYSEEFDRNQKSVRHSALLAVGDVPPSVHINDVPQLMKELESNNATIASPDLNEEGYKISEISSLHAIQIYSEEFDRNQKSVRHSALLAVGDVPPSVHLNDVPLLMKELESNNATIASPDLNEEGYKISEISSLHAIQTYSEEFDRNQKSVRHSALLAVGNVPPSVHLNDVSQLMKELESNNATIASPDLNEEGYKISEISSLHSIQNYSEEFDRNQKSVRHSALLAVGDVPPSMHLNDVPQLMKELEINDGKFSRPDSDEEKEQIIVSRSLGDNVESQYSEVETDRISKLQANSQNHMLHSNQVDEPVDKVSKSSDDLQSLMYLWGRDLTGPPPYPAFPSKAAWTIPEAVQREATLRGFCITGPPPFGAFRSQVPGDARYISNVSQSDAMLRGCLVTGPPPFPAFRARAPRDVQHSIPTEASLRGCLITGPPPFRAFGSRSPTTSLQSSQREVKLRERRVIGPPPFPGFKAQTGKEVLNPIKCVKSDRLSSAWAADRSCYSTSSSQGCLRDDRDSG